MRPETRDSASFSGRARKTARRERPAAAADHSSVPAISI
ncbi:hypothetical protein BURPS668_A0212 [Burkholderia pseudomallei 668]|nr:hypothetical protein BURPS668_A0212 [Burkholderia pseudomallei 668]